MMPGDSRESFDVPTKNLNKFLPYPLPFCTEECDLKGRSNTVGSPCGLGKLQSSLPQRKSGDFQPIALNRGGVSVIGKELSTCISQWASFRPPKTRKKDRA